jgi:hypothetical protein
MPSKPYQAIHATGKFSFFAFSYSIDNPIAKRMGQFGRRVQQKHRTGLCAANSGAVEGEVQRNQASLFYTARSTDYWKRAYQESVQG